MTDVLTVWGLGKIPGFLFKDVLSCLVQEGGANFVKSLFVYNTIKDIVKLLPSQAFQKACFQGMEQFFDLLQAELEEQDLEPNKIKTYIKSLKKFTRDKSVRQTLALAFEEAIGKYTDSNSSSCFSHYILQQTWQDGDFKSLPDNFDWEKLGKRYLGKVKAIVQESDELRKLFDTENLAKIKKNLDEITPTIADFNLERYRQTILDNYSRLRLDSLDTRDENNSQDSNKILRNLKLWQIFVPQHLVEEGKQERLSVLSLLQNQEENDYPYLVILGNPGSGKSTLAQYGALTWAKNQDFSFAQELPLIIELKLYSDNRPSSGHNFIAYLAQGYGVMGKLNHQELTRWFEENKTLLIFDGLDEILDKPEREKTVREIIDFKNTYPQVRILITSRVVGYEKKQEQTRLRNAGFRQFRLQDLDEDQIKDFLAKWHQFAFENQTEGLRKQERLLKALAKNQKYQGLAGNPLLLTMMAILNRYNDLPNDKASLYEDASKVLLERWEADKNFCIDRDLQLLDVRDKQEILRNVAFSIQEQHSSLAENLFIEREDLRNIIAQQLEKKFEEPKQKREAELLLDRLTSRNFLVCLFGDNKYGFIHRTFLEYFCAWYWVWQFEKVQTVDLERLKEKAIMGRWQDESWHEVISLIVGTIHESHGVSLVEYLIHEDGAASGWLNLVLAEKCLTEARSEIKISVGARRRYNVLKSQYL